MKKVLFIAAMLLRISSFAQENVSIFSPDRQLKVNLTITDGKANYSVTYQGIKVLENSPLGLITSIGDFSKSLTLVKKEEKQIDKNYQQSRIKKSEVRYVANQLVCTVSNAEKKVMEITFNVSNNDIAFRYGLVPFKETANCIIEKELTGFSFPTQTTTFLTPQAPSGSGWMRTKPSYEEEYEADAPLNQNSKYRLGYTFPALFHVGKEAWALVSETGVTGAYCGSKLSESNNGTFSISFPEKDENNGHGSAEPAMALPATTPWRTITVGTNLKPIVETTIPFDVVDPLYAPSQEYKAGRATWSWIMWQDESMNYDDQITFIDLAQKLGYEYILMDALWDKNVGYKRMEELIKYAHSKKVDVFLWYNSNGAWNNAPQGPKNCMDNTIARKKEMKWLKEQGVKGLKVDFFGGDKQETIQLYEEILSDANEYGLMIIFHGCTLPRGWERMYPNYVSSEAVLASENLIFNQHFDDNEAFNASLHPFIRNTVGSMDFGGTLLNKRLNKNNNGGRTRKTTDIFQLATAVLFQTTVQNFALTPNNLTDVPSFEIDFMKKVPTTWDETVFVDGYPGKYCVLARRHGSEWYLVGINAEKTALKINVKLPMFAGKTVAEYSDDDKRNPIFKSSKVNSSGEATLTIQPEGGVIWVK
ncbi:glycoside hydrolase family 97 catalytic domain-containing protein [Flectobacillus sp. DC10W]|uniref:Glycoside hydrolase family 97 catalytic domain-containing protein n=1 Tax=Flectobacillus longus TaxID=2984207 RepID=A0ABT6YKN8_9BACT|nr:glycoside hydrolase family 97 protein [Flectobacillus longus]MDI9864158.1 glycoside hydrolase family 97 catalytic domain-containing protein [Flectobacillus longus]